MHGAGNDYVYVNCFEESLPEPPHVLAPKIADRRFGVGGDGLILIEPSSIADARMRMFNADGSEAEMCGNGIRCVAKYVYDHDICRNESLKIETGNGVLSLQLTIEQGRAKLITVDMGVAKRAPGQIPTTFSNEPLVDFPVEFSGIPLQLTTVSMGNPHCVIFVPEASDELVLGVGPLIENDPHFPQRTNVEFVEVISRREVRQRTWERGSGETWACGTGASAVCVAGYVTGRTDLEIVNHLRGGDLRLRWDTQSEHVFMTGGAEEVFTGVWPE